MQRFIQKDFWQLNMAEPVPEATGSGKRLSIRQRMMDRLHRLISREADAVDVVSISYLGAFCEITINTTGLFIRAAEGTGQYFFTETTTVAQVVEQLNSYGIITATIINPEVSSKLAKAILPDTIVASENSYIQYPTSLLWQEMQVVEIALDEQRERISAAERQMYLHSADSNWLDIWASYHFGIERNRDEADAQYLQRALKELLQPNQNNIALEQIVSDVYGVSVKIRDAVPFASELPPPYTADDARNRFLLDMAIPADTAAEDAETLITRIKALVRKHKAAGTDFAEVPLRKHHNPDENIAVSESYKTSISISNINETLIGTALKYGAGWKYGTTGLKYGNTSPIKEQAVITVLNTSNVAVQQHLIGG